MLLCWFGVCLYEVYSFILTSSSSSSCHNVHTLLAQIFSILKNTFSHLVATFVQAIDWCALRLARRMHDDATLCFVSVHFCIQQITSSTSACGLPTCAFRTLHTVTAVLLLLYMRHSCAPQHEILIRTHAAFAATD